MVERCGGDLLAVRTDGHGIERQQVPGRTGSLLRGEFEDASHVVGAAGDDGAAVGAEGDGDGPFGMAAQAANFGLGLHVPDADDGIGARRGHEAAVGREDGRGQR